MKIIKTTKTVYFDTQDRKYKNYTTIEIFKFITKPDLKSFTFCSKIFTFNNEKYLFT